jgi:2-polyprenyl-3-methyl-5-hydroxy-6-metoxy-1,4-benzoquinol methylase
MESSDMSTAPQQSWVEYYQKVYAAENSALDYSRNSADRGEILQAQTFGIAINRLRERHSHVRWEAGSLEDAAFCESLGEFDVVFIIELLQLVDWRQSLRTAWKRVSPGGRIVAICPNRDNAIIQKTIERFGGSFGAPNPTELTELVAELPEVECWAYRGMDFQQDQRIVPYVTLPWTNSIIKDFECNRLAFVIQKKCTETETKS